MRNETAPDGAATSAPSPVTTTKPSRKRRSTTPRAPRQIDPGVAAIRKEASARVAEYHRSKSSGRILSKICNDLMPKMTDQDVDNLSAAIAARKNHVAQADLE